MNAGAPDTAILTRSAFITPRTIFQDFRGLNLKAGSDGSSACAPQVNFVATNWHVLFHAIKQRRGMDLPTDLWRIKLRRHIEKA
jgi:hypothetical protein